MCFVWTAENPGNVTVSTTFVVLALIGLAINLSRYNSPLIRTICIRYTYGSVALLTHNTLK